MSQRARREALPAAPPWSLVALRASRLAGLLVALVGAVYLAAWLEQAMTRRGLSGLTMKTNAALSLLLLGVALALDRPDAPGWRRVLARVAAGAALVIGALTLAENLFGWDLGLDEMLAREAPGALGVGHPNRMGTPASLSVVLASLALLVAGRAGQGARARLGQAAAVAVLGISFLSIVGHLYEAPLLYGVTRVTAIALPTALALFVLAIGLLASRPRLGFMALVTDSGAGGSVVRRMLPSVLLLPVLLGWIRLVGERARWFGPESGNAAVILVFVLTLIGLSLRMARWIRDWQVRLRENRGRLERAEAIAHLGSWETDADTGRVVLSEEARRILAVAPGAATGREVLRAVHPDDRPAVTRAWRASLEGDTPYEVDFRVLAADGTVRWIHQKGEHTRDADGRLVRSFGMVHDVTDRHQAAEERDRLLAGIERDRALLEAVIEHLPVGLGIAEAPSGRLLRINEQTRRIWRMEGMDAARTDDYARYAGFHRDGRPYGADDWQLVRALKGEVIRGDELEFVRGDGTRGVMRSNAGPVRDRDGRIVAAVVAIEDVTREQEAVDALRRSEERYRILFGRMTEGFAVHEVVRGTDGRVCDYRFLDVNPAFQEMTGLRADQVLGRRALEVLPGLEPFWIETYGRVVETGEPASFERRAATLGRWYQVSAYRTGPERFAVVFVDVTARKEAENALLEANRKLQEAGRGKDEFLALLSHELRNPLAPIRNSLYVLERAEPGGEHARRALAIVQRQTAQLARLVDDLLDVTRIMRNKIPLRLERLEMNDLVRSVAEDHRSMFEASEIRLEVSFSRGPLHVNGDWNRLAQIVGNLMHNAVKFTPRGGSARIAVSAEPGEAFARIAVTDTGIGMTRETLARLFEPFVQAETSLDRTRGGLGIGLALVKGIVELHGGTVGACSDGLGRGSELFVRLPLVHEPAASDLDISLPGQGPARRVLVIEDNVDSAESLSEALSLLGHQVATAYDGPGGLERARAFRPDVVLCDLGLPGMNGFEVARTLKADPALGRALLVAVTGYVLPDDLRRASEAGFDRHLAKPASLEAIEEALAAAGADGRR